MPAIASMTGLLRGKAEGIGESVIPPEISVSQIAKCWLFAASSTGCASEWPHGGGRCHVYDLITTHDADTTLAVMPSERDCSSTAASRPTCSVICAQSERMAGVRVKGGVMDMSR